MALSFCNISFRTITPCKSHSLFTCKKSYYFPSISASSPNGDDTKKRLSEQSSWEAKDSEGEDYLYRLGKESDNMNIAVGARAGVIDDLFTGKFLGTDSDIVFDYRQKAIRTFEYWQGNYYIAPLFMGKMSCLMINDIEAGLGRFGFKQMTVNNQIVVETLMNLCDNPKRVGVGQDWGDSDITNRIPIIVTGNDLSTIYAPLIRDGRMDKFYWQPTHEDIVNIVHRMYEKDGISKDKVNSIVNTFPNQALDFYGALRSWTYDRSISKWIEDIGGVESLGNKLLKHKKDEKFPVFVPPEQTVDALLESGHSLIREQKLIMESKLSKE